MSVLWSVCHTPVPYLHTCGGEEEGGAYDDHCYYCNFTTHPTNRWELPVFATFDSHFCLPTLQVHSSLHLFN